MGLFSGIFSGGREIESQEAEPAVRTRRVHNPAWPIDRYGPTDPDMAEQPEDHTPWWRR